jgi:hypothetical protein
LPLGDVIGIIINNINIRFVTFHFNSSFCFILLIYLEPEITNAVNLISINHLVVTENKICLY